MSDDISTKIKTAVTIIGQAVTALRELEGTLRNMPKGYLEPPPCMTVRQVADHFAVSTYTVYAWINSGEISYIRLPGNGHCRIRRDCVEEFEVKYQQSTTVEIKTPSLRRDPAALAQRSLRRPPGMRAKRARESGPDDKGA